MAPVNSSIIVLGLRIAQAVLAVITLGLSAYGTSDRSKAKDTC